MTDFLKAYKPSAVLAMACGIVTILLGIAAGIVGLAMMASAAGIAAQICCRWLILVTLLINLGLHIESYITNIRVYNRRQDNVLAMVLVEAGYLVILICSMFSPMDWTMEATLFAAYIWVNASSLAAMPVKFARNCGIVAMATAAAMYLFGRSWSAAAACMVAICLIVNGYERLRMSLMGGKKVRKS